MKRIITYGTYDLLHYGHIALLKRARALGDFLVVALSSDEFNAGKGKQAYFSYDERRAMLESVRYVDLVVPELTCVFVMGDDWSGESDDQLKGLCEIVYLPRTPEVSTMRIKNYIGSVERLP